MDERVMIKGYNKYIQRQPMIYRNTDCNSKWHFKCTSRFDSLESISKMPLIQQFSQFEEFKFKYILQDWMWFVRFKNSSNTICNKNVHTFDASKKWFAAAEKRFCDDKIKQKMKENRKYEFIAINRILPIELIPEPNFKFSWCDQIAYAYEITIYTKAHSPHPKKLYLTK